MESKDGQPAAQDSHGVTQMLFRTAGERYGIDIMQVQEIIGLQTLVQVPCSPPNIDGVIDLRGHTVPVLSLRGRFGLEPSETTDNSCIIVLSVVQDGDTVTVGIKVDEVDGVHDIDPELVEPPPSVGAVAFDRFLRGVARVEGDVVMLLDVHEILGPVHEQLAQEQTEQTRCSAD